jgi:radical SAM-linked protein
MPRLLFEKTDNAVWISHLDLMRLFQRAFKRAGLPLTHSGGFTPRPQVSIALPLSVGVESKCELLDFDLDGQLPPMDEIRNRLNAALVPGIQVLDVYQDARKIRDLALLDCVVTLEYDRGVSDGTQQKLESLFAQESLVVEKKSKNGLVQQDLIPMIRNIRINRVDAHTLLIQARICCQKPTLNPAQLIAAIERYIPECLPDFTKSCRVEIYDTNGNVFR